LRAGDITRQEIARFLGVARGEAARPVGVAITTMLESREVMNIREASDYLGVSRDTLYRYIYEDRIPAFKLGNRWKFKKTLLDRWMEKKISLGSRGKKR
jgi:excisionase family DNA binding protein